jgi:two-component system chemotaxis sensor kinase CheA
MRIPLTLAIVPALTVKSGGSTYAIPQVKLEELVRVDQSGASNNRIEILHGTPVYRLRGNILPLLNLNSVLTRSASNRVSQENVNIAVLDSEQGSFGLIIDEVQDTADIVVKPINRLLKTLQVYSGATILGDGSVALILDVQGLAKAGKLGSRSRENPEANPMEAEAARARSERQDFLLFGLSSPTKHAIPLSYVNRLEEFKCNAVEYSGTQRVIRYGSSILPLISANRHLGYSEPSKDPGDPFSVIVIQRAGTTYGIEVNEIIDTLSTQEDLDPGLISDSCIFGNLNTKEELVVVLDPFEIISREFPQFFKKSSTDEDNTAQTGGDRTITNRPLKILLVEDTAFFRKAIRIVLEKSGIEVHAANDGQDAIEILNKRNTIFDMVISDIEMPRMNGFQLAEAIRQHPEHRRLPLLAVSSRADRDYMMEGKKAGFDIYLEKLKPNLLLGAISELTSKSRSAA